MSTVHLTQRMVLTLFLSAWVICLPVLTASGRCITCSADYQKQCSCTLLKNECHSSSLQQCNKCITGTAQSELPARGPCPCCQYRSEIVSALQVQKQRTQKEGGRIFVSLHVRPGKLHPLLNVHQVDPITQNAERSVDRCICLCSLTI